MAARWSAAAGYWRATLFNDGFLGASHSFKFGGEMNLEGQWNAVEQSKAQNLELEFNNGVASRIRIRFPTASVFLSGTFTRGRVTLNIGIRCDHYKSHIPEQPQLASTTTGFWLPDRTFPAQTFFTWDSVVPRAGLVLDLLGDGRTVFKAN